MNSLQPQKGPFFGLKKFLQEKLPGNQKLLAFLRKRKSVSPAACEGVGAAKQKEVRQPNAEDRLGILRIKRCKLQHLPKKLLPITRTCGILKDDSEIVCSKLERGLMNKEEFHNGKEYHL